MTPLRLLLPSLLAAALAALPAAAQDAPGVLMEAARLLAAHGHAADTPERQRELLLAVARVSDPGASVTDAAGRAARAERDRGVRHRSGIRFASSNETVQVIELLPGTPAVAAGIPVGAALAAVDGAPVASNRLVSVLQSLRREGADKVRLDFRTRDGKAKPAELTLAPLPEPALELAEVLPGGFGYLLLNGLHAGGADAVVNRIQRWESEKVSGLILDLRDAGGEDLDAVARLAGLFAPAGKPLFTLRTRAGAPVREAVAANGTKVTMPVLVLLNRGTTGAAELLAGALEHGARGAMLVGEPSAGDPLVREFLPVSAGHFLRLATRVAAFPDGFTLDGSGPLEPEMRVADANLPVVSDAASLEWELVSGEKARNPDPETLGRARRVGRDAVLQRAVDILLGLKALNIRVDERAAPPVTAP